MASLPPTIARPRGRPAKPEHELVDAMLAATTWLLLNQGYAATTMEAVAKHAGMAKKTLYRYADNREELVGLVVRRMSDGYAPFFEADVESAEQLMPALEAMLGAVARNVLSADAVGLFRLLTSSFPGREEMLAAYQRNGIERGTALLRGWMERQRQRGLVDVADAAAVSELLLGMAIAEPLRRMALGLIAPVPQWDAGAHIKAALALLQGKAFALRPPRPGD